MGKITAETLKSVSVVQPQETISTGEAAQMIGASAQEIIRLIDNGELEGHRMGTERRPLRAAVAKYLLDRGIAENETFCTTTEAGKLLGISHRSAIKLLESGDINFHTIGKLNRDRRVHMSSLREFLRNLGVIDDVGYTSIREVARYMGYAKLESGHDFTRKHLPFFSISPSSSNSTSYRVHRHHIWHALAARKRPIKMLRLTSEEPCPECKDIEESKQVLLYVNTPEDFQRILSTHFRAIVRIIVDPSDYTDEEYEQLKEAITQKYEEEDYPAPNIPTREQVLSIYEESGYSDENSG